MTTDQISHHHDTVHVRFARHEVPVPEPLGALLNTLAHHGRSHVGIGSPTTTRWLFPGGLPGRPITPARLAERLRTLGIPTQAARRAALIDLAAKLPAAILAELLNLHPTTAVRWTRQATSDWSRYAAEIAHDRSCWRPRCLHMSRQRLMFMLRQVWVVVAGVVWSRGDAGCWA